jgi:hypothetical protein
MDWFGLEKVSSNRIWAEAGDENRITTMKHTLMRLKDIDNTFFIIIPP